MIERWMSKGAFPKRRARSVTLSRFERSMPWLFRARSVAAFFVCAVVLAAAVPVTPKEHHSFAALITRLSEPGGYFDSDNLISNETSYLHVMAKLKEIGVHGGVYVGVGPDQNFTYIAKIKPRAAVIIDIRRDNLLQQFLFKALFEHARNRIEYLCLLFGKPFPKEHGWEQRGIKELADYIDNTASDQKLFARTTKEAAQMVRTFDADVSTNDLEVIERIEKAFFESGLDIRYSSHFRPPRSIYPTYRDLLLEHDLSGNLGNYLNTEEDFKFLKKMQEQDLIIPIVGDLAGPKALKAIGAYIAELKEHVSAFYTSNVEFYLSREGTFEKFAENVKSLPIDEHSVIIRSYFNYYAPAHPQAIPGHFSTQLLERISDLEKQCDAGNCASYNDIVTKDSIPLQ
jgi:hypothetical protein